jgi:4-amino-4-deoxy-L-arabinose transferase-like glycosyltransferase
MPQPSQSERQKESWYFTVAVVLLLVGVFFRLWHLSTAPPGMSKQELINAQIAEGMKQGDLSVIYDEAVPAREGAYHALLAISTLITGKGVILWRLPSVWIAMLTLAVTASLIRYLFGDRVALMTLGLMAVSFWPVWMGRAILRISLVPLVTAFIGYTFARAFRARNVQMSSLWFTLGGIALGAAQYVHVISWTMLVLFVAFVFYRWSIKRDTLKVHGTNVAFTLALFALLILPLLTYLSRHPGVREPVPLDNQPRILAEIPGRVLSSIGALALRGDLLPDHNLPGRPVMGPLIGILAVIGIGVAIGRWKQSSHALTLLWLGIGLIPTAFLPQKPDFEFMGVIQPVTFVFPAIGLYQIYEALRRYLPDRVRRWSLAGISGVVTLLIALNAVSTYRDYFVTWPMLGDVRYNYQADLGVLAHYLDTSQDRSPVSVCTTPVDRKSDAFALTNQELLSDYLMHRRDLPIRYFDCTQSLILADGGASQRLIFPRGHYYDHLPGPLLAWMRYAEDEHVPDIRPDVVMRVDVSEPLANQVGAFITTAPTAWPPESGESGLADLPVSFGYNLAFLGYQIRDNSLRPTDWVELTTFWRLDGPPPPELRIFAHLLGNPVVVMAQADNLGPRIDTLQTRDVFLQYSMIQTPGRMAPGYYPLSVGLYNPTTSERLQAYQNGEARANRIFLERVKFE